MTIICNKIIKLFKRKIIYPNNCLKGIPNKDFLTKDGAIASHLFHFKEVSDRDDRWTEQSINWEDNDSVTDFTLNQKNPNGEIQFKAGVAIIPRNGIDKINKLDFIRGNLSYERKPIEGNPYHGNILLNSDIPKRVMKLVAGIIAQTTSKIVLRDNI